MAVESSMAEIQQYVDLKLIILTLSLIITNGLSIYFYLKNRKKDRENRINERLFKIQDLSMQFPFLENKKFIDGWIDFKKKYNSGDVNYDNEETQKYLQYEQYCEMIFNFVSDIYTLNNKKESSLSDSVALKPWVRAHKYWWGNPLEDYSNHDIYDKSLCSIINNWLN